ncbi:hypothetical protein E1B28_002178 [Marasmius oreades]|uniref:Uncharacterized protein n=1 Tax=Marasmius oreades TaxID=181124 RepID=A0A9P7RMT0_9AGAR|nr:uncharacterized protein E1B28_002178 [Marasmius oreades]KAG7086212.1 hypothetical protein E1B28_002178 [Marasmius oreades]
MLACWANWALRLGAPRCIVSTEVHFLRTLRCLCSQILLATAASWFAFQCIRKCLESANIQAVIPPRSKMFTEV